MNKKTAEIIILHLKGKTPDKESIKRLLFKMKLPNEIANINIHTGEKLLKKELLRNILSDNCYLVYFEPCVPSGLDYKFAAGKKNINIFKNELDANDKASTAEVLKKCFDKNLFFA